MWNAENEPFFPGFGGAPTGKGPDCEHGESGLRGPERESTPFKATAASRPSPELQDLHDTAVLILFDHAELFGFKDSAWTWVVECPCDVWYYKRNK